MRIFFKQMIGASFSMSVFLIIMLVIHEFNLYGFNEDISNGWIWLLFYGYGILCASLIELIGKFIPNFTVIKQLIFYILFGYLIFFIVMQGELIFAIIAGTVGAFFALLFWMGKAFLKPAKWYAWLVFVIPLISLAMVPFDLTSKVGWYETKNNHSLTVEYDYFNGKHLVPIKGEKGEEIYFTVEHKVTDFNSYGMTIDVEGPVVEMEKEEIYSIVFKEKATKNIFVTTDRGRNGKFQVKWWKEK